VFAEVLPSAVPRLELSLAAGAATVVETRASFGASPVLHVWDVEARREVARDQACAWPGCDARVRVQNATRATRTFWVIARARDNRGAGELDLVRDGRVVLRAARVAGTQLAVARGAGYAYQLAAPPGGSARASLYALDRAGRLLALDDESGPLGLPSLERASRVQRLIVASRAPAGAAAGTPASRLRVYANDLRADADGDGLGFELERVLGSCDGLTLPRCARSPLADYYRSVARGTADSDRDGLEDGAELLGLRAGALDLPRWGADLRHKDVFIEVDYHKALEPGALDAQDIADIAALFAPGSARALRNPDGLPGVRLHLDAGLSPADPRQQSLFGAWGGSGRTWRRDYKKARSRDFDRARRGVFRYALLTRGGTGQASVDAFTINRDLARVPLFAHELGHTLGLRHHGHDAWGMLNCKPNYRSVMAYTYQNRREIGFSRRASPVLDGSRMNERAPLARDFAKLLAGPPFELEVVPGAGVDWNRDGVLQREPVRAAPTWSTYKSCAAGAVGRVSLASAVAAISPALVRLGDRLHALWVDGEGQLSSRSAAVGGADADGSCPLGDGVNTRCADWSEPAAIAGAAGVRGMAVLALAAERAAFARLDRDGLIQLSVLSAQGSALALADSVAVSAIGSDRPPALARMAVDPRFYGTDQVLSVFFRAVGPEQGATKPGTLLQASALAPAGPFQLRAVIDQAGQPIESALGPSVLRLGTGELCAVFPDLQRAVRVYCYVQERDHWLDLTRRAFYAGLGPETGAEVALAYHRYRGADGLPLGGDDSRGALYLAFSEPAPGKQAPDNPNLWISAALSARHGAFAALDFRWRGTLIDQWTHLGADSGIALYEDETLSALKAALVTRNDDGLQLNFLPLADGSFAADLHSGDDFEVMERGICVGLRGPERCGGRDTGKY